MKTKDFLNKTAHLSGDFLVKVSNMTLEYTLSSNSLSDFENINVGLNGNGILIGPDFSSRQCETRLKTLRELCQDNLDGDILKDIDEGFSFRELKNEEIVVKENCLIL